MFIGILLIIHSPIKTHIRLNGSIYFNIASTHGRAIGDKEIHEAHSSHRPQTQQCRQSRSWNHCTKLHPGSPKEKRDWSYPELEKPSVLAQHCHTELFWSTLSLAQCTANPLDCPQLLAHSLICTLERSAEHLRVPGTFGGLWENIQVVPLG